MSLSLAFLVGAMAVFPDDGGAGGGAGSAGVPPSVTGRGYGVHRLPGERERDGSGVHGGGPGEEGRDVEPYRLTPVSTATTSKSIAPRAFSHSEPRRTSKPLATTDTNNTYLRDHPGRGRRSRTPQTRTDRARPRHPDAGSDGDERGGGGGLSRLPRCSRRRGWR